MKRLRALTLTAGLVCVLVACGGRLPPTGTTREIVRRHFNKYAKKYEKSPFGNKKVLNVEILGVEEIHKKLASAQAFVTMEGADNTGPEVYKVRVVIEKGPFGWRTVAWENLNP